MEARLRVKVSLGLFASGGFPAAGEWSGTEARGMGRSALRRFVLVLRLATSWKAAHPQDERVCHWTENSVRGK